MHSAAGLLTEGAAAPDQREIRFIRAPAASLFALKTNRRAFFCFLN